MVALDVVWTSRVRVSIVRLVTGSEVPLSVEDMAGELGDVSRRTVGRHVRVLAEAGVLVEARDGDGRYVADGDVIREGLKELSQRFRGVSGD